MSAETGPSQRAEQILEGFETEKVHGLVADLESRLARFTGAALAAFLLFGVFDCQVAFVGQLLRQTIEEIFAILKRHVLEALAHLLGLVAIKLYKQILRVPRSVLMPIILCFCLVGAFAINNTAFDIGVMLVAGILAFFMERNGFPIAPAILGVVLGGMLEENFATSMIKAEGNWLAFFERPIAGGLGVLTLLVWLTPLPLAWWRGRRRAQMA